MLIEEETERTAAQRLTVTDEAYHQPLVVAVDYRLQVLECADFSHLEPNLHIK
jgi:hypothetical protein